VNFHRAANDFLGQFLFFHFPILFILYILSIHFRNRTAPRMITAVNVPDATSLSTILTEQASRRATSFFVTN
jgi:hypothetical protein